MGFIATDSYLESRRKTELALIEPQGKAPDMRTLVIQHIRALAEHHNSGVQAKLHYLETGEVRHESVRQVAPFIDLKNDSQKQNARRRFSRELVAVPDNLDSLSDNEVLKAYGELLLCLRELVLPDPEPA